MSLHKYRIEAGTGRNAVVGQVDVQDGRIVATPPIWAKFKGQALHRLEWWLASKMHSVRIVRLPDPGEPMLWDEVPALKAQGGAG